MRSKRKIPREANGRDAVTSTPLTRAGLFQRRRTVVGVGLSLRSRRELLEQMVPHYRHGPSAQKRRLLDAFTQITGYHRKYAIWLLNHAEEGRQTSLHPHPGRYGSDVQEALVLAWNAANRICAKRLIPFLPALIEAASAA